jgi:hypothetical protein
MEDAEQTMNGTIHGKRPLGRRRASARWVAWAVFVTTCAIWAAALLLDWITRGVSSRDDLGPYDIVGLVVVTVLLAFPATGLVIATRRPATPIGWLLLAVGLGWGLLLVSTGYADYGLLAHPGSLPAADVVAAVGGAVWATPVGLLGTFLLLLFPNGHLPGQRWRWVAYAAALLIATTTVVSLVQPGGMRDAGYPDTPNPLGIESLAGLLDIVEFVVVPLALTMVASAVSLVVRFRRSGAIERQQIKWLAAAATTATALYAAGLFASGVFGSSTGPEPLWQRIAEDAFLGSFALIPISIGVAVLRHRLYGIDVIIRKTLVYAALVGCLAILYLGGVFAIQAAVRTVSGQSGTLAVTVSTLLVAVAFQPLRARIQRVVDHRFYRARYDAARTLEAFSGRLREQVEIETVSGEVLAVVRQTLQPAHVSLWLRSPEAGR